MDIRFQSKWLAEAEEHYTKLDFDLQSSNIWKRFTMTVIFSYDRFGLNKKSKDYFL